MICPLIKKYEKDIDGLVLIAQSKLANLQAQSANLSTNPAVPKNVADKVADAKLVD